MVNGPYLYSASLFLMTTKSTLQFLPLTHSHTIGSTFSMRMQQQSSNLGFGRGIGKSGIEPQTFWLKDMPYPLGYLAGAKKYFLLNVI